VGFPSRISPAAHGTLPPKSRPRRLAPAITTSSFQRSVKDTKVQSVWVSSRFLPVACGTRPPRPGPRRLVLAITTSSFQRLVKETLVPSLGFPSGDFGPDSDPTFENVWIRTLT
jgi:hypothetical protein